MTLELATAVHEAGHAVVSIALGLYPESVCINDDPRVAEAGRTTFGGWILPEEHVSEPVLAAAIRTLRSNHGAVIAAGQVAEDLASERDAQHVGLAYMDGSLAAGELVGDEGRLVGMALRHSDDPYRWIRTAYGTSVELIRDHWDAVRALADKLLTHRELRREELWELSALDGVASGLRETLLAGRGFHPRLPPPPEQCEGRHEGGWLRCYLNTGHPGYHLAQFTGIEKLAFRTDKVG